MLPISYTTEAEVQKDLADLAGTPAGAAALFDALNLPASYEAPTVRAEVEYPDPEGLTAQQVPAGPLIALDIETTGLSANENRILSAAVCAGRRRGYMPSTLLDTDPWADEQPAMTALIDWLNAAQPATLVTWNGGFDLRFLVAAAGRCDLTDEWSAACGRHGHVDVGRLWRDYAVETYGSWRLKVVAPARGYAAEELDCSQPLWWTRYSEEERRKYNLSDVWVTWNLAREASDGWARPCRTDLEIEAGGQRAVLELKHRSGTDASQLARYDRLVDDDSHLLAVTALPAGWSTWAHGERAIEARSFSDLVAGLHRQADRLAAVADRLEASVRELTEVAEDLDSATEVGEFLPACDRDESTSYHTSNGRVQAVLCRLVADAGIGQPGPTVDVTRAEYHPPVIVERVDLGGGVQVGFELDAHREKIDGHAGNWLTRLDLAVLVWTEGESGVGYRTAEKEGGDTLDRYVKERLETLAVAAPHFADGSWGADLSAQVRRLLGGDVRWGYGAGWAPDKLLADETGVRSWLRGYPSTRSAGLQFKVPGYVTYGTVVDLIRLVHTALMAVQPLPAVKLSLDTDLPDWDPHYLRGWTPRVAQTASQPARVGAGANGAGGGRSGPWNGTQPVSATPYSVGASLHAPRLASAQVDALPEVM